MQFHYWYGIMLKKICAKHSFIHGFKLNSTYYIYRRIVDTRERMAEALKLTPTLELTPDVFAGRTRSGGSDSDLENDVYGHHRVFKREPSKR